MTTLFERDPDDQSNDTDRTTDACGAPATVSPSRLFLFLPVFLTMIPGALILFMWLGDRSYGIQVASMIGYTAAAILYTFSANRGTQRYLFECPYVRSQFPRLAVRHISFVVALFLLQTAILSIRPHLSPWWTTEGFGPRGMPPFMVVMFILCGALLLSEIMTNRSLLNRAHAAASPR